MKVKKTLLTLTIVSLLVAMTVFAAKPTPKVVPAPTALSATVVVETVQFAWIPTAAIAPDEVDAVKYSIVVEGTVTYKLTDPMGGVTTVVGDMELSFGTSDRTDEEPINEPYLTVAFKDLANAIIAAVEVPPDNTIEVISLNDASAKVKGLAPGNGPQKNPFSDPAGPFSVAF